MRRPTLSPVLPLLGTLLESIHDFFYCRHGFLGAKLSLDRTLNSVLLPSGQTAQLPGQRKVRMGEFMLYAGLDVCRA